MVTRRRPRLCRIGRWPASGGAGRTRPVVPVQRPGRTKRPGEVGTPGLFVSAMLTTMRLRDGSHTGDPRLDRIVQHDERNRRFRIAEITDINRPLRSYRWNCYVALDQGSEGACVGFGFAHELAARPVMVDLLGPVSVEPGERSKLTNQYARELYWEIQRDDPWEGGAYPGAEPFYEGTSVLSGAKVIKRRGFYDEYRWAYTEKEMALAVAYHGPVVIGVNWYEGMMRPDGGGFINPTGRVVGGHCVMVNGIRLQGQLSGFYWVYNSWGADWGVGPQHGTGPYAKISRSAMDRLIREDGDVCLPRRTSKVHA